MVGSAVETIVWSSAASSMPSIRAANTGTSARVWVADGVAGCWGMDSYRRRTPVIVHSREEPQSALCGDRVLLCPGHDVLRVRHRLAVVGHEHRHGVLAGEALGLATAGGGVEGGRQDREPVGLDHLGIVPGLPESVIRVRARMPAGARRRARAPADVEL